MAGLFRVQITSDMMKHFSVNESESVRFSNTAPRFQWWVRCIAFIQRVFVRFSLAHGRTPVRPHVCTHVRECDTCMFGYDSAYGRAWCYWRECDPDDVKDGECWYEGGEPKPH